MACGQAEWEQVDIVQSDPSNPFPPASVSLLPSSPPPPSADPAIPSPAWAQDLRQLYDAVVEEPLPDSFLDLLSQLDADD